MRRWLALAWLVLAAPSLAQIELNVEPQSASIGDPIALSFEVVWPDGAQFDAPSLGPRWGGFEVLDERWEAGADEAGRWRWTGTLAAFELGELELPARTLEAIVGEEGRRQQTVAASVEIVSVIEAADDDGALSVLRSQLSLDPDLTTLIVAALLFALLMVGALGLWWYLKRRAARPVVVRERPDPFARQAPHEWVYAELQRLLERKLPEQGEILLFYTELSRILKSYLSGRFRVDLMERTTEEVAPVLESAGVAAQSVSEIRSVLGECDAVKFAAVRPQASEWKGVVERIYRIVDRTKPAPVTTKPDEEVA